MFLALGCAVLVLTYAFVGGPSERADASVNPLTKTAAKDAPKSLVRTDPGIDPWVERDIPPPKPAAPVEHQNEPTPPPAPVADPRPVAAVEDEPVRRPEPDAAPTPDRAPEPGQNRAIPTQPQTRPANQSRNYDLPPGAIMSLTIPAIGLEEVPILNSNAARALDRGVVHLPDTSLPWSSSPERNVYLAGHRLGWPGTGSHRVFFRLDELTGGETVTLRGENGESYDYRVIESFIVGPQDGWVTGRVRGRDLVTLQTCTPIPSFEKRLIVRAERI